MLLQHVDLHAVSIPALRVLVRQVLLWCSVSSQEYHTCSCCCWRGAFAEYCTLGRALHAVLTTSRVRLTLAPPISDPALSTSKRARCWGGRERSRGGTDVVRWTMGWCSSRRWRIPRWLHSFSIFRETRGIFWRRTRRGFGGIWWRRCDLRAQGNGTIQCNRRRRTFSS